MVCIVIEIIPYRSDWSPELLTIWQAAFGATYPIPAALFEANTTSDPSFRPTDTFVARQGDRPVGFLLTKRFRESLPTCERYADVGYLALMAILPDFQRQGVGQALLEMGEKHLREEGAQKLVLGGSFHHFLPGLPESAEAARHFFTRNGYTLGQDVWDVRRRLSESFPLPEIDLSGSPDPQIRPYREDEAPSLLDFLQQTFPGRWARDVAFHLERGGGIADVMGLFHAGVPGGFALLHPPGSAGVLRWAGFNPRMAALGPIGISPALKGNGLGMALLVRGIQELKARGSDDMVIDWTDLLAFYGRCGFSPWQRYTLAQKVLE